MDRIFIINPDARKESDLAQRLQQEGYQVMLFASEAEALQTIYGKEPIQGLLLQSPPQQPAAFQDSSLPASTNLNTIDFIHHPDFAFGPFKLIFTKVQLLKDGKPIPLSYMESKLLMYLVLHRETVVSTNDLMRMVWGYGETVSSGTIYTHVSWLRKKLKTPQMPGGYINTVRNMGYIFSQAQ
ncbi:MAG: winged helix-turn-helix transcriptional regulator [Spirochaetaceae bacterium]|nr:winged helix-turn-helix transcriptional regulator [Spirochaetaceae bacterium]MBQ8384771.1 winged helix-turn-helix transcriptional regulator [Spirochaetaceae bacterium]